jgi:integrase
MAGKRTRETHLMPKLYVKRGRRADTYYTHIGRKYHGLGSDRALAERALRDLQAGRPVAGTIAELCARYVQATRALIEAGDDSAIAQSTLDDYAYSFERNIVPVFGAMRPQDFRPSHAAQYLARMRAKGRAVRANREVAALASAFAYAMSEGIVDANPCHGVRRNKERPRVRRPLIAEVNAFAEMAKLAGERPYMIALIGLMVAVTGRRRSEIMGLTLHAVTEEGLRVSGGKVKPGETGREYLVGWSPLLRELVAGARGIQRPVESIFLFPTRTGTPYTDAGFKAMWGRQMRAYVAAGGEAFRAHDLRAMYVTELTEQDRNPETHANAATTRRVYDRRRLIKVTPLA